MKRIKQLIGLIIILIIIIAVECRIERKITIETKQEIELNKLNK